MVDIVVEYNEVSHATRVALPLTYHESVKQTLMIIGLDISAKYTRMASEKGYFQTAKNMRKQGFTLVLTRRILFGANR